MTEKWNQALFPYFIVPFLVLFLSTIELEDFGQLSFFRGALCDNTTCIPLFKAMFFGRVFCLCGNCFTLLLLLLFSYLFTYFRERAP